MWHLGGLVVAVVLGSCSAHPPTRPSAISSSIADVRLVDGACDAEGRVEVLVDGQWGTICDDKWGLEDAEVICRSLNKGHALLATQTALFGEGSGPIWLDGVGCRGDEVDLNQCDHQPIGIHDCIHKEDAGVLCSGHDEAESTVRLVGGSKEWEGRVEILVDGEWGTVCDDGWDLDDAEVVCRELGYQHALTARGYAHFGEGTLPIHLDGVACEGHEASLIDCPANDIGDHDCGHHEDAGVDCSPFTAITPTTTTTTSTTITTRTPAARRIEDIRLAGTDTPGAGRLEVLIDGEWGSICDDFWDIYDAEVACRQLGYVGALSARTGAYFGEGYGRIWLDGVSCTGEEESLDDCRKNDIGSHDCSHTEDAGVECIPTTVTPREIEDISLVGGITDNVGRVEVLARGEWGTVCDDSWDIRDAQVVCRQLGYPGAVEPGSSYFGPGTGRIWLDNVACTGEEESLEGCAKNEVGVHNCGHNEDVGVECALESTTPEIEDISLVGGITDNVGRVEVLARGEWGTVCDDSWDIRDAQVVCRQLGYPGAVEPGSSYFGPGTGRIWLDNVACTGEEESLEGCAKNEVGVHNCGHNEDVGVECALESTTPGIEAIRLVDGATPNVGRVEVLVDGEWGTVCDDGWEFYDALVACRQLGYPGAVTGRTSAYFSEGTGPIWLDEVACTGDEESLVDCPKNDIGVHNCGHSEDAGVECALLTTPSTRPESLGTIRLVEGQSSSEGRVEILVDGEWGTICDDNWDEVDGAVACRQLGFDDVLAVRSQAFYGEGTGPILLDDVACDGSESNLIQCVHSDIGVHNCGHGEDAGLECSVRVPEEIQDVRLVGGSTPNVGRIEVLINDEWGTVCDDYWDLDDAEVACKQLGYVGAVTARTAAYFGEGSGEIWLDDVQCVGSEETLNACSEKEIGSHNCGHAEDAGVECALPTSPPAPVSIDGIRLVGGESDTEGRVEISVDGEWGTVCDDNWDVEDGLVACRQLGYDGVLAVTEGGYFGEGTGPIWLDDLMCNSSESSLVDCGSNGIGVQNCGHWEDAGVRCIDSTESLETIRLVDGQSSSEGRVEILVEGEWGTICDDYWDDVDGAVACRQLGFDDVLVVRSQAFFGQGTGPILLDDVVCDGSESSLIQCDHSDIGVHNCGHSEDAGLECSVRVPEESSQTIRLVNGQSSNEGRVEILVDGEWGTVCDDYWDEADGAVACRQLGFDDVEGFQAFFGEGTGPIWLDDVVCNGSESSLLDCDHNDIGVHNCGHGEDAGLECSILEPEVIEDIRLVGGNAPNAGRVEVLVDGEWGTICNDLWAVEEATVVCRQLGFSGVEQSYVSFERGSGDILLDDVECTGLEDSLNECEKNPIGEHNCGHIEDVGIECTPDSGQEQVIRLVGGDTSSEGRVEILVDGEWGTVCDDGWDEADGTVACRQLGFNGLLAVRSQAYFGQGNGSIWLDDLYCDGSESSLVTCGHKGIGEHNCQHSEDAGLECSVIGTNSTTPDGTTIRLVDGQSSSEGRVEILVDGVWGTICDDMWDNHAGAVACRQLGFEDVLAVRTYAYFGQGTGPIWLDDVVCNGSESDLLRCDHNSIGEHNCGHTEDAGLECIASPSESACPEEGWFECVLAPGNCYQESWGCDGVEDCPFGSDEANCEGSSSMSCEPEQFQCFVNQTCIPEQLVCDGDIDCPDASDEWECEEGSGSGACGSDEFQCYINGACISDQLVCDYNIDCPDASDEWVCDEVAESPCRESEFQCTSSATCIPGNWRCDGVAECPDQSDELECEEVTLPPIDEA